MSSYVIVGNIITMDTLRPRAQAMGIQDGVITAIGSLEEVRKTCSISLPEYQYQQGSIVPGLIDTHNHMMWTALQLKLVDLGPCRSIGAILDAVAKYAADNPDEPWVSSGPGWHVDSLQEGRYPTRQELDSVCADRPVFLPRVGHAAAVNTLALKLAGIDKNTPDPRGGRIIRDESGDATGVLMEPPAFDMVGRLIPALSVKQRKDALRQVQALYHAAGITGVIDPGISREDFALYQAVHAENALTVRTVAMPLARTDEGVEVMKRDLDAWSSRTGAGDERLKLGGVKVYIDGGASLATALMREPYPDERCNCGIQVTHTPVFHELSDYCVRNGWSMGVHAVGGKAIDIALSVFDQVNKIHPLKDLRFHLIHAYLWPSQDNVSTAARLGVGVATQSSMQYRFAPILVKRMGEEAVGRATPIRDWLDAGVVVGGGSDSPVTPYQPLLGIWHSMTRYVDALSLVLGRDQSVSAENALALYTRNAAWIAFSDHQRGVLKPGMLADWTHLSVNPLTCEPDEIRHATVLRTAVSGELVHGHH